MSTLHSVNISSLGCNTIIPAFSVPLSVSMNLPYSFRTNGICEDLLNTQGVKLDAKNRLDFGLFLVFMIRQIVQIVFRSFLCLNK